jgi:hypothetical protein
MGSQEVQIKKAVPSTCLSQAPFPTSIMGTGLFNSLPMPEPSQNTQGFFHLNILIKPVMLPIAQLLTQMHSPAQCSPHQFQLHVVSHMLPTLVL